MSKTNSDFLPPPQLTKPKEPRCSINFNSQWWQDYVPSPNKVINALIDNGYNCSNYKLFDRSLIVLNALKNLNVNVVVAFNNWELFKIINEPNFIDNEIKKLLPYEYIIKTIVVGNEPLGTWYDGEFNDLLVPAIKKVSLSLNKIMPYKDISVPFNFAIFTNTYPPSNSIVSPSLNLIVFDTLSIIKNHSNNGRVMVNIYPYLTHEQHPDTVDLNFAIGYNSLSCVRDGEYLYTSLFDMMYDAAIVAMHKQGFNLPLDIGEVGWPDSGGLSATKDNECLALNKLHISSTIGTPRKSGPINIYYFEAIDEPWKDVGPGLSERHWGILTIDLKPKCTSRNNIIYKNTNLQENTFNNLWLLTLLPLLFLPMILFKTYKKKPSTNKINNRFYMKPSYIGNRKYITIPENYNI